MRHNYPRGIRKDETENYDTEYEFYPDNPEVSMYIDHNRKLKIINLDAHPYYSKPVHIRDTRTFGYRWWEGGEDL